jgi:NADH-quinone oxidoreductase subunit E
MEIGDTVKRIQGDEVPILTPWLSGGKSAKKTKSAPAVKKADKVSSGKKAKAAAVKETPKSAPKEKSAATASPTAEKKPRTMKAPRKAGADDLKLISGVGPKLEGVLNELGFYHFDQIAKWTDSEAAWVDTRLKFKGRIERDGWIDQATTLAAGGETAFSKKASK